MKINYIKLTAYILTFLVFFIAFYDETVILLSGNIDPSVSIWFAAFGGCFVPMFGISFLLGHFYGVLPSKTATKPAHMTKFKFACTFTVIATTLYDVLVLQFFNPNHAISSIPVLVTIAEWPISVIFTGVVCGKYLGTMSPTRPVGDK